MSNQLTFGSLFSGIGGIDLGLERAGMKCYWQVEIDGYAQKVLAKHWPDVARFRDVRECGAGNLHPVDVIAGGFPCQDISDAGKREGIGGERSGLWKEFARIIGELRPRYVLVENVAALINRGLSVVLGDLAALGYDAEWQCLPAAAFGAPHLRWRVFIVAYANGGGAYAEQVTRRAFADTPDAGGNGALWPVADAARSRSATLRGNGAQTGADKAPGYSGEQSGDVAHSQQQQSGQRYESAMLGRRSANAEQAGLGGCDVSNANGAGRPQQRRTLPAFAEFPAPERSSWWAVEPRVDRVVDGVPSRVDRLRGLGNAVVPDCAEYAGRFIQTLEAADAA